MPETKKQLYSHHVFLLPFKWNKNHKKDDVLDDQDFFEILKALTGTGWQNQQFRPDTVLRYNEFQYFYDYVSEILYDRNETDLSSKTAKKDLPAIRHFEWPAAFGGKYLIKTPKPVKTGKSKSTKTYELVIDSVLLHLYYTGVGVLSFHLQNRSPAQNSPEDILYINQFGRRVFPSFFNIPSDKVGHPEQDQEINFSGLLPVGKELAYQLEVKINENETFKEDWSGYLAERLKPDGSFKLPVILAPFLSPIEEQDFQIRPVLDDRMFVGCWYGNKKLADELSGSKTESEKNYLTDEWWYKFVHIDAKTKTIQNAGLQAEIINKATNARWSDYGTFFGVTDYSFVMLTGELDHLRKEGIDAAFLVNHLQTMYYKLSELALVQRATVQRFSDEVTHISRLDEKDPEVANKVGKLYQRYIRFVNRIYFREVTAQVQGIELYDKLHEQSRLREQVGSLKQEIHDLHNYTLQVLEQERVKQEQLQTASDEQRNQRLELLTVLGVVFLPPSLLLALFGVSILGEVNESCEVKVLWWLAGLIVSSGVFSWLAYKRHKNWLWALGLVMLLGITSPVFIAQCQSCKPENPPEAIQLRHIREQLQSIRQQFYKFPLPLPVVVDTTKTISK